MEAQNWLLLPKNTIRGNGKSPPKFASKIKIQKSIFRSCKNRNKAGQLRKDGQVKNEKPIFTGCGGQVPGFDISPPQTMDKPMNALTVILPIMLPIKHRTVHYSLTPGISPFIGLLS